MRTRHINGQAVAAFREIRELSATELAAVLGVNVSTISRVETGARQLSPGKTEALARALGVDSLAITYPVARTAAAA